MITVIKHNCCPMTIRIKEGQRHREGNLFLRNGSQRFPAVYDLHGLPKVVLVVRNPPANAGDIRDSGSIPGSGSSPGAQQSNLLQYSFLENPMDRGAWQATVHGVAKGQTRLKWLSMHTRDFHSRVASMSSQAMWNCFQGFLAVSGSALGLAIRGFWTGC